MWSPEEEAWSVVEGVWSPEEEAWSVVEGVWSVDEGGWAGTCDGLLLLLLSTGEGAGVLGCIENRREG